MKTKPVCHPGFRHASPAAPAGGCNPLRTPLRRMGTLPVFRERIHLKTGAPKLGVPVFK